MSPQRSEPERLNGLGELSLRARNGIRLVLARHGQTPSNVRHALDTLPPGPELTGTGRDQADRLADRLTDEPVLAVYASRALRARRTAEPLARRHGLNITVAEGMQEIFVGELEGTVDSASRQLFEDIYASWHFGKLDEPMPAGETGRQALSRFLSAAQTALDAVDAGRIPSGGAAATIALVSHGAMLRLVAGHLADEITSSQANAAYLPNTGMIVLEAKPDGWQCVQWDGLAGG